MQQGEMDIMKEKLRDLEDRTRGSNKLNVKKRKMRLQKRKYL